MSLTIGAVWFIHNELLLFDIVNMIFEIQKVKAIRFYQSKDNCSGTNINTDQVLIALLS
jgi:hypothetical protein